MENKQKSSNEAHSEPLQQCNVVCRYYHPCVGYGDFVREYNGPPIVTGKQIGRAHV